ncbi:MAG: MOP flippase family protein [Alistipes sp.]|nr:MOP flippase family protein [Alistipes sp.]
MDTRKVVVSGVKWTTLSTIITTFVALLRLVILTRILDKADFGIVSILTFVVGMTQTFSDLGFSSAIMHKKDLSQEDFSSLYWLQLIVFTVLYVLISVCSPLVSSYYNEHQLTILLPIILTELIMYGIGKLYETVLQKEFCFKTIAIRNIISSILSLVVAVVLAFRGYGVYSLVYSTLFNALMLNLWNFICGQRLLKLKFHISLKSILQLIKIGLYQTGTNVIDYVAGKLDVLLMGKFLGMENLGIYTLAKELLVKVFIFINSIANKVLLPVYAKIYDDTESLSKTYLRSIRVLSFITFPILLAFGVFSDSIIDLLYGEKFAEVSSLVLILALSYMGSAISNPIGSLTIAKGRTDISFYYAIIRLVISLPVVWITSSISIICLAYGQLFIMVPVFFLIYYMMIQVYLKVSLKTYIQSFSKNLISTISFACCVSLLLKINPFSLETSWQILLVYGIITTIAYVFWILLFYRNDDSYITLLPQKIQFKLKRQE